MLDPSFFSYVTVMSITPGPNNLLLASSGVNYGLRRTLPMMLGIVVGCAVQTLLIWRVLDELLRWMESLRLPLTLVGGGYLLWLAWKLFRAGAPAACASGRPMTLTGAALFQLVNPKAWLMCSNVALLYAAHGVWSVIVGFSLVNFPCIFIWALMGDRLGRHLQVAWKRRAFNTVMALMLVATTLWMMLSALV
ncbi:LysE family translocator [Pantoea sp. 1.19]|uniref:LysE family translocator n=1 Tax=Pantoea sp. 1.19 TaxID=1925589 RepID=UPI000948ACD0|nr:LysE family translocator [Pantoea sp. 1.19]